MFIEQYPSTIPPGQTMLSQPCMIQNGYDPIFYKLPPADQAEYVHLMNLFAFSDDRNKRNLGMATFVKHLGIIHSYVCRGDAFDALRGMICGIEFGLNSFLINTSRLKKLMCRSKSCMNGCFQKLGYNVCRPSHDISTLFSQILPGVSSHILTVRQWCVRKAGENSQLCFLPNIKIEIVNPHQNSGQYIDMNSSTPPSSPMSPLPEPPKLHNFKPKMSIEYSVPSSLPSHFQPPIYLESSISQLTPQSNSQFGLSDSSNVSGQQDLADIAFQKRNRSFSATSMVGSLPIKLPPLLSVNDEVSIQPNLDSSSNQTDDSHSSILYQPMNEPRFMFDISTLLNHETNGQNIRRMDFAQLPQLSC